MSEPAPVTKRNVPVEFDTINKTMNRIIGALREASIRHDEVDTPTMAAALITLACLFGKNNLGQTREDVLDTVNGVLGHIFSDVQLAHDSGACPCGSTDGRCTVNAMKKADA